MSDYLPETYKQKENNAKELKVLFDKGDLSNIEKLKNVFIFIVSSNNLEDNQYIWLSQPIEFNKIEKREWIFWRKSKGYSLKSTGWKIGRNTKEDTWSKQTFEQNVEEIIKNLEQSITPYRLDKNEAIMEANEINYYIQEIGNRSVKDPNIKLEVWSIHELLNLIRSTK